MKNLEVDINNNKETLEDAQVARSRAELMIKDLGLNLDEFRDILEEEKDRNRELIIFRDQTKNSIQDIKNALHREISVRESLENDRRNYERQNQIIRDTLDQEKVNRSNIERDLKRSIEEIEDFRARIGILNNSLSKAQGSRSTAENDEHSARKTLNEINRNITQDNEIINNLENEIRKIQQQVQEVQDIAGNFESEQRRSEVEIAGLIETTRFMKEELERVRIDSKTILDEKRDLEDKAKLLSKMLK